MATGTTNTSANDDDNDAQTKQVDTKRNDQTHRQQGFTHTQMNMDNEGEGEEKSQSTEHRGKERDTARL